MDRLSELKSYRQHCLERIAIRKEDVKRPNDGWPLKEMGRSREIRDTLIRHIPIVSELPEEISEWAIFRSLLGDWSPNKEAEKELQMQEKRLKELDTRINMIEMNKYGDNFICHEFQLSLGGH